MAVASSIFLSLGFILSVVIAPQLRIWTWGPTMACLSLAGLFALPTIWRERKSNGDLVIALSGTALVFWIMARAALSPVPELAQSDMLLTAMAVATFLSLRAVQHSPAAQKVFVAGIVAIVAASIYVIARQVMEPGFSPLFPSGSSPWPAGFYGHYSYGASFLLATSFILAGLAFGYTRKPLGRILLGLLAILAFGAIYYTKSRGAFIGAVGGLFTFFVCILVIAKRDDRKWFGPAIIALPVVLGISAFVLLPVVSGLLAERAGAGEVFDNAIRLHLLGIAVSCIQLHPLIGGGARSFSWECFRFWEVAEMGAGSNKPEHVHNELVQTASDYGMLGATLLLIVLIVAVVSAFIRSAHTSRKSADPFGDAMRIGGAAGFAALFIQSNFEGIFRIPPGAILLAMCLSGLCLNGRGSAGSNVLPRIKACLVSLVCLASCAMLAFFGTMGTRATFILWNGFFGTGANAVETKIDAAGKALEIWPLHSLALHRGMLYQQMAASPEYSGDSNRLLELSLLDFQKARALHPFDPTSVLGTAVIFGQFQRDVEAETAFQEAIRLQGAMEAGFKARYLYAKHMWAKGNREFTNGKTKESVDSLSIASKTLEDAFAIHGLGWIPERYGFLVKVHTSAGRALEELGDSREAMNHYERASSLPSGNATHYYVAMLYAKLAIENWKKRNGSDALFLFLNARQRIGVVSELPSDITAEKRDEWISYLDRSIGYLRAAKYEPSEKFDF